MIDKSDITIGIFIGGFILIIVLCIGLLAGKEFSDQWRNPVIVAELSDGGFLIEDARGERIIVYKAEIP